LLETIWKKVNFLELWWTMNYSNYSQFEE
jgi:hypothetical protein